MPPAPAKPAHTPTARGAASGGKTLVIVDSVPGMISAAPTPVSTRQAMSVPAEPLKVDSRARDTEDRDAGDQRAAAAEAVADRAGGQEQRRERDGVAVDDPLRLARRRPERRGEGRDGHGHHRDPGDDQHQRKAHRGEHRGAAAGRDSAGGAAGGALTREFGIGTSGEGKPGTLCFRN